MGYINRRKALVEARDAANNGDEYVRAATRLMDFDAACQPQVEELVEAVVRWREEFWSIAKRGDVMAASVALDANADEVAGHCGEACHASRGERCPICGRGGK